MMHFSIEIAALSELRKCASKARFMRILDFPMALLENC
jgi:hypothetical protein